MSNLNPQVDVAVIGAGPAGSTAAILLARAGCRVIVFEKKHFPRDKVCGGCLSGSAVARLRMLLGADHALPGIAAARVTFVIGAYRLAYDARGLTRVVLRSDLDACLAETAAAAGAELRFAQTASLVRGAGGWDVLAAGARIQAGTILVAAGLNGMPAKLGIAGRPLRRRMIAQQWLQPTVPRSPALGEVEMHWLRGGYVGLATPTPGRCVVAVAAEVPDNSRETAWLRLRRLNPRTPIWSWLPADAPRKYGAKGAAGFPWSPLRLGKDNVLLIGDAAGHEEPFSGEGMGLAMCSGACAAQATLADGDVLRRYTALMRRHHRPFTRRLRLIGDALRNPLLHDLAAGPVFVPQRLLAHLVQRVHMKVPA